MQHRTLFLTMALLIALTQLSTAYSRGFSTQGSYASAGFPKSEHQRAADRRVTFDQRSLYRECLYTAQLAEKHMEEFVSNVNRGRFKPDQIGQHLAEIRGAVDRMLQDHGAFIRSLNEQQWDASKDSTAKLELLRAQINAKLQGIDYELQMPAPQSKVLTKYGRAVEKQLKKWQKLHRKVGAAMGLKRYP